MELTTTPPVEQQRLVLRLQQTRKFASAWKRLGDIPKYFNSKRGPSIWDVVEELWSQSCDEEQSVNTDELAALLA